MGLPEEDRGPAWLRNWGANTGYTDVDNFSGYVDGDALAVDIQDLVVFADALQQEHEQDFRPHVREVYEQMEAVTAQPDERFVELVESLTHHRAMLEQTSTVLYAQDQAVMAFVEAARSISESYRGADAMTAARVGDVEANLGGSPPPSTQPVVVTPEQAAESTPEEPPPTETPPATTDTSPDDGREYS